MISYLANPSAQSLVEKIQCERSLYTFIQKAWHVLEPATPFEDTMHTKALCLHLEAMSRGGIGGSRKLIANIPPGFMKSVACCVMWPAWEWTWQPETRWLFVSYSDDFAMRDAIKMGRVIKSDWYRGHWGNVAKIVKDTEKKIENSRYGFRYSTSLAGGGTGTRADRIVLDDANKVEEAYSDSARKAVTNWYDQVGSMRGSSPKTSTHVVVQQRVHQEDISGHLLARGGWTHFFVPLEFDPARRCKTPIWEDPRTEAGESCWPDRWGSTEIAEKKKELGLYGAIAQLQQDPQSFEGGIFKRQWFKEEYFYDETPKQARWIRFFDLAATEGGGCFTCGVLMGATGDGLFWVEDVVRGQWAPHQRNEIVLATVHADRLKYGVVKNVFEEEGGSAGKDQALAITKLLVGFAVWTRKVTGSKIGRAVPYAGQCGGGTVRWKRAPWLADYINELVAVAEKGSKYLDQCDASSGAANEHMASSWSVPLSSNPNAPAGGGGLGFGQQAHLQPNALPRMGLSLPTGQNGQKMGLR